uniref:MARVEL domain-containing protein n=1 Tax=Steinernema glaseri TaxID=37863 RepID=A0A1I7YI24_9BILA
MAGRTLKQETYTTRKPDGTYFTETAKTTEYVEDGVALGFGPGSLNKNYCCLPQGILRIVEIVLGLVIVSLITAVFGPGPFKGVLFGQTFLLIFAGVAFCVSFIFLVVFFFDLHHNHLDFWPWRITDFMFSAVCSVFYFVMCFVEAYYSTGAWANNCNDIGGDGIIHNGCRLIFEWAFAAFFCLVNGILYAVSAFFAHRNRREYGDE